MNEEMTQIPQSELDFCRKVIELAKEHGCSSVTFKYRPPHIAEFWYEIEASWQRGRHNEAAKVHVQTGQHAWFEV